MKWNKASERLPTDLQRWYIVRQANNTRSSKSVWWEHIHGNVEGNLKLPLYNIEWLDESTPAEDCEAVYLHVDYNTLRTLELTEDAIPRWEEDGSMEKGDRLYKATLIKTY